MDKSIQEQHDYILALFQKYIKYINEYETSSKFPLTIKVLMRFSDKIDSIKHGLISAEHENNFYTSQILLRTLFEHQLVAYYIWTKNRLEKSDIVAEKYFIEYLISEFFKQKNYELGIEGIVLKKPKHNTFENIKKKYPKFEEMKEKQLHDIHNVANQFDIRKIGAFLNNEYPEGDYFPKIHKAMLDFLKRYNQLSSYVHAGAFADKQYYEDINQEKRAKIITENKGWSLIASRMIKEHIIYALASDIDEIKPALREILIMYER